jgi:multiple sugar transport system permease protein
MMVGMNRARLRAKRAALTLVVAGTLLAFLVPLAYGFSNSFKSAAQIAAPKSGVLPMSPATASVQGSEAELFVVPMPEGGTRVLAALEKTRTATTFADPAAPTATIEWKGNWRTLERVMKADPHAENYAQAWKTIDFPRLLKNTAIYAFFNTFGILLSSSFVAYGFSRFKFPGKRLAFMVVMGTMILPSAVTLIPTYAAFNAIGWVGTWLPLIVPAFFSNAYNVFLLRQFFLGIPQEMDDAARIDGANPLQTLYRIILPQSVPALVAAGLFNFFYCWNDYFTPLVYLSGKPSMYPITVGLGLFSGQYNIHIQLVQAASVMSCIIPVTVFFFTQRFFMQGVVVTGVEK